MNQIQVAFTLFLLSGACKWSAVSSQDVDKLATVLHKQEEIRAAVDDLQEYDKEVVQEALNSMKSLWTVHLPNLLEKTNNSGLSEKCFNATMDDILESRYYPNLNLTIPGARLIPLLDAAGKQGAGLLTGNVILDGAYDECFSYDYTSYCVANSVSLNPLIAKNISIPLAWTVGLCIPKQCNSSDISLLINSTVLLQADERTIKCIDSKILDYNAGAIIMLIVTGIFVLLVIVGTVVDTALAHCPKLFEKETVARRSVNDGDYDVHVSVNSTKDDSGSNSEMAPLLAMKRERCKYGIKPSEFITAFSLFKTVPTLLATKQSPSVITSLNGLRVISMFWVILGHTYFWLLQGGVVHVDNLVNIRDLMSRFSFQAMESAFFAVDSFFFLSGVLVAYLALRQMKKDNGRFPFVHFYVHRYLRLTPTYAFVLFFAWFLTSHLASGPGISMYDALSTPCTKYWWTNLLYINNLYPWKLSDECMGWSWYLSNDMQFYVISPLILIAAYHLLPVGLIIAGLFMLSGFIITATFTGVYDFQSNLFSAIAYNYNISGHNTAQTYTDAIYIKPWDRISPYIVGLLLGYLLFRRVRFKFGRIANAFLYGLVWAVAAFVALWIAYGLYFTWHGHVPTTAENVIYITFSRFFWASSLALMVFACHNGYGWFINSFLSMKFWTPLARMTFSAYLVHPILLNVIYGQLQTAIHYTDITIACYAIAFVVLSFGVAAIVCVLVELPLGTVEMLIFKLFGSKGRDSQRQDVKADYPNELSKSVEA